MGREEWISVLKLSTLWRFEELRKEALEKLSGINWNPLDKVVLARAYSVQTWLVEAYIELIKRDKNLDAEAWELLGYETSCKLYQKRENSFWQGNQPRYVSYGHSCGLKREFGDLETDVRNTFQEELKELNFYR
jgi:hypothetical protein